MTAESTLLNATTVAGSDADINAAVAAAAIDPTTRMFVSQFATALAEKFSAELGTKLQEVREDIAKKSARAEQSDGEGKGDGEEGKEGDSEAGDKKLTTKEMIDDLCKLDSIYDSEGNRKFVPWDASRCGNAGDEEIGSDEYSKWVMVLRRVFEHDGRTVRKTKLDIKSPLIRKILRDVVTDEQATMESEKASIEWPNSNVFRYRNQIREAAEKDGELAVRHISVLMKLIEKDFASKISDVENMFPKSTSTYGILREAFWAGDLIVDRCSGFKRAYRLVDVSYYESEWDNEYYLDIEAQYIDYNGEEFGTSFEHFRIKQYKGVKYLYDLPVFPIKYLPQKDELLASLLARGKKFVSLKGQNFKTYNGICHTLDHCRPLPVHVDSRIMIDTATFNRINPDFSVDVQSIASELVDGELTDEHLILLTNKIGVFSFQNKTFYHGKIENVHPIAFNEKVFDQLVLPQKQKELIRVLVQNHQSKSGDTGFDDFVEGKGKGLVSVLHGPPGVGKTMTAEAVAEFTKRPLYIVTSGELGADPSEMEREMERVLDLAMTFRAVLLIDEADVFLEQRTMNDLIRNALVSIFLRQLEYYQGILFLTTNRVGTFDDAFHSRIHISLHYTHLSLDAREKVWRNFAASMLTRNPDCLALNEEDYKKLAQTNLNGRQIKNIFRTCQALAADKGEPICMEHMNTVLEIMSSFDLEKAKISAQKVGGAGIERE